MDGEVAGNQSCTGFGESWDKKFVTDGLWAQTCLPVDRILVKDSNVWRRPGRKRDSDIMIPSENGESRTKDFFKRFVGLSMVFGGVYFEKAMHKQCLPQAFCGRRYLSALRKKISPSPFRRA